MKTSNTAIIVCCHKEDIHVSNPPYLPLQVGKELSPIELDMIGDNTGDNISLKNKSYCELTGLYWAWKNLQEKEVIGLCHYRRYFDFYSKTKLFLPYTLRPSIANIDFNIPDKILNRIKNGEVVVPRALNNVGSLFDEYCIQHISDDIRVLEQVINERCDEKYKQAFNKIMHLSHKTYNYNMFIMNRQILDKYCSWLFFVLGEVENRIDISNYSPVQKRVFGYMAERLLCVFIEAEKIKVIEKPLWFIMEGKQASPLRYIIKCWLNNIGFSFSTLYIKLNKLRS